MSGNKTIFYLEAFLIGLLILLIMAIILLSLVPPVSKDALVHHLAVPKLYLKHGGMYEIPFMPFSYYPMNMDLLYMIPLYFGNDIAPKFIHFTFALLTAGLIYYYLIKRTNALYALLGAALFLSIPIIVKLSITVYVDLGEIFFSFSAILLLLKWIRSGFRIIYLLYSGVLCGLALGTKYNGLITLALLTLFIPYFYSRYQSGETKFFRSIGHGFLFLLIALLIFSPWMIRNYHWKSNPIYPLYDQIFNTPEDIAKNMTSIDDKPQQDHGLFTYRNIIYHESGWQIALLPLRIFLQGRDGDPQYFDGKLNPFLLFLPIFAFFGSKNDPEYLKREKKIILAFAVLFFSMAFFSTVLRIRYISPIIPPLVLLSIFGVKNIAEMIKQFPSSVKKRIGLILFSIILFFVFWYNVDYLTKQFEFVRPLSYIARSVSRDEYIENYRPEYPVIKYINHNLKSDAKVYFVFLGNRGYYCDRDYIFGVELFSSLIRRANNSREISEGFQKSGITHLLIYNHLFEKWINDNFSAERLLLTQTFFKKHLELLYFKNGFGVLELKER
jgi:4-amino-4-deoxy-L-arabinose transferase-like glycosyltransferase